MSPVLSHKVPPMGPLDLGFAHSIPERNRTSAPIPAKAFKSEKPEIQYFILIFFPLQQRAKAKEYEMLVCGFFGNLKWKLYTPQQ